MVRFSIYPYVLGVSQSIERILNSAKWSHHKKIQYGLQDGCCSEYYPKPVHSYPREIMLVYIPKYSAADNGFCQGRAWGECALHLWAVNQLMTYFYAAIHWDNIYEVRSWSRGNSWYYAERACSLPLGIEPPYLFEADKGHCLLERGHLIRSRPPQRRVPFNNKGRRW